MRRSNIGAQCAGLAHCAWLLAISVAIVVAGSAGRGWGQTTRPMPIRPDPPRAASADDWPQEPATVQFDGPFLMRRERNRQQWQAQDGEMDRKLEALRKRFNNKRPNIILILATDVGWGELGCYLGGKVRGTPTDMLDRMAGEGMKFLSAYSEPTDTPARVALLTGRQAVRTGLVGDLWPGSSDGLNAEEVTLAELLSQAGYDTAMWGLWRLGEMVEFAPENQGFDTAHYGLYGGEAFNWPDVDEHYERPAVVGSADYFDFPSEDAYAQDYSIRLAGFYRGSKGGSREEVNPISSVALDKFEAECGREIVTYIKERATSQRPFFIYWASSAHQVTGSPKEHRFDSKTDPVNNQAAQLSLHDVSVGNIVKALMETDIDQNTLVLWYSSNGPSYAFYPNSGYTWLRGGKGDAFEGGVRVPAIAFWPGMIEAGRRPKGLIHISDLFMTVVRIANAEKGLPVDRVFDGIDQTALLLGGMDQSRRDYLFHYIGKRLAAVRCGDVKFHLPVDGDPAAKQVCVFNIHRDPAERFAAGQPYQWMIEPMRRLIRSHQAMMRRCPNRSQKNCDAGDTP